ncbi:transketolase, partial [Escherichia coli]|nr:transketolase [Escherichia coli]
SGVHGAPLGADETKLTKEAYSWTFEEDFYVPEEVYAHFKATIADEGAKKEKEWNDVFAQYKEKHPELAAQFELAVQGKLPEGWEQQLPVYETGSSLATRASSGEVLNA